MAMIRDWKRLFAAGTAATLAAGGLVFAPPPALATVDFVANTFEISYDGWTESGDQTVLTAVDGAGWAQSRGLCVTNRQTEADGVYSEKGFYLGGGASYDYAVLLRNDGAETDTMRLKLTWLYPDGETYGSEILDTKTAAPGEWVTLTRRFRAPADTVNLTLTATTDSTSDFTIDNVTVRGTQAANTVSAADAVGLKDIYAKYFRLGGCINPSHLNNSKAMAVVLKDYNSITCENEMKPDATLVQSTSSGTNVGVKISSAASIMEYCSSHNIAMRGHTFVWHSQTPQWFFKENYDANGSWVSEATMNARLDSYIQKMFALIAQQYPNLNLYAYDVANECVSDSGGARQGGYGNGASPWVQVYGDNGFLDEAFAIARKYAPAGCSLFYNDYNEYMGQKMLDIESLIKRLYGKGILDGVGMQSHVGMNFPDMNGYQTALNKYNAIGCQIQVTELDLDMSKGEQAQAEKYQQLFQAYVNTDKKGDHVTAICIWGVADPNWRKDDNATLYNSSYLPKAAYTAVASVVPQSEWGDGNNPAGAKLTGIEPDENGYYIHSTFESNTDSWSGRGAATAAATTAVSYAGNQALAVSGRTGLWNGASHALPSATFRAGEAYSFSVSAMHTGSSAETLKLTLQYTDAAGNTQYDEIASVMAPSGVWMALANTSYQIPAEATNAQFHVETLENTIDFYIDEAIVATNLTVISAPSKGSGQRGDVNNDGRIDGADLSALKRGILRGFADKDAEKRAEIDGEDGVTAADAKLLADFLLRRIDAFPTITPKVDNAKMEAAFAGITLTKSLKTATNGNPLITQRFSADPGVMTYDGRVYVYTTNDTMAYDTNGVPTGCNYGIINKLNCISSADLVNWTDHGAIPVAGSSGTAKWASCSWAPAACHKVINGKEKFFLYFANNANGIGVLTSDSPTGPWTDPIGKALISRNTPTCDKVAWVFDPAVLVDDDGTGYLYFGGGRLDGGSTSDPGTGRVVKLGADMTSLSGNPVQINAPYLFEDSGINKIDGKYYYNYCTNWSTGGNTLGITGSTTIAYCVSDNPMGPFTFKGEFFKNPATFGKEFGCYNNNHHTLISFRDNYYLFYHARAVEYAMGVDQNYRSAQVDKASVSADGKLQYVTATMTGPGQLVDLNPFEKVQAETMAIQAGVNVSGLGDTVVSDIARGDWVGVKGAAFGTGASAITVRVSSKKDCAIRICTGSASGKVVGYVDVPSTNGSFQEMTAPISGLSGKQDLYFVFSDTMEFDSWQFTK